MYQSKYYKDFLRTQRKLVPLVPLYECTITFFYFRFPLSPLSIFTHAFFTRAISCVPASCPVSWALAFRRLQRSAAARISHNLSGSPELIFRVVSHCAYRATHHAAFTVGRKRSATRCPCVEPASWIRHVHDFGAPPQLGFSATSAVRRSSAFQLSLQAPTECRTRIASDLLAPASRHVSWGLGTSTPALRRSSGFCVRASYRVRHSTTSLSKNFSRS